MSDILYFDSAATTNISEEVLQEMMPFLTEYYGNASSHYFIGVKSREAINNAREIIASSINAKPEEIYFTSGGSEGNSWVIKGLKNPFKFHKMHIITSNIEHHSISSAIETRVVLNHDIEASYAEADKKGIVQGEVIADIIRPNTRLISVMTVNNEVGTVQSIQRIAFMAKDNGAYFHTDAVQAFGHMKFDVDNLGIDMMTVSGHKIHAPKGVGFVYISNDVRPNMFPLIDGGQQERGLRGSTENVAGIVGLGKAVEIAMKNMNESYNHCKHLSDMLLKQLNDIPGLTLNVPLDYTDYRHINIRVDGIRAEELMAILDTQGICVSAGSACNSYSNEPSHVLKAIGLTDDQANSSIRISIDNNDENEIHTLAKYLKYDIEILRRR